MRIEPWTWKMLVKFVKVTVSNGATHSLLDIRRARINSLYIEVPLDGRNHIGLPVRLTVSPMVGGV